MNLSNTKGAKENLMNPLIAAVPSSLDFTLVMKEQHEIRPDLELLDPVEHVRYQRLLSPEKQLEFLTGRTFLKSVLAEYLNVSPQSISLSLTPTGKPYLPTVSETNVLFFNLSHAEGHYLIGLSKYPIGVDIEPYRQIDLTHFRHFLTSDELQQLMELPGTKCSPMFFRLFTAKEAFLKATDKGWPLDAIQFQLEGQQWKLTAPSGSFYFAQADHLGCYIGICVYVPVNS